MAKYIKIFNKILIKVLQSGQSDAIIIHKVVKKLTKDGFLGSYDISIDDKGRIRIPSKFRAALGEDFVISCGNDACLVIYPAKVWEDMSSQVDGFSDFDMDAIEFKRAFFSNASFGEFDSAGRVLVPLKFRSYASFKKDLIAVGANKYFEIWDSQNWESKNYNTLQKRRESQVKITEKVNGRI